MTKARTQAQRRRHVLCVAFAALVIEGLAHTARANGPPSETNGGESTPDTPAAAAPEAGQLELKPRFELFVPSAQKLVQEAHRSRAGAFLDYAHRLLAEMTSASAEGLHANDAWAIFERVASWPDTPVHAFMYAPDREGHLRWAVRVDWPTAALADRLKEILASEAADDMLDGVALSPMTKGQFEIRLRDEVLAFVRPSGDQHSAVVQSHQALRPPTESFIGAVENPPLVAARLNMAGTERDSGATFLSSFSAVTAVDYFGRVNKDREWAETIAVYWPPISGMGAKVLLSRVKRSFFVPDEAFGAAAFNAMIATGLLDNLAGFGAQVRMSPSGEMEVIGEFGPGPLTQHTEAQICLTLLPGTGFLPAPDIVFQSRTTSPQSLLNAIRKQAQRTNELYNKRDEREPWHETTVGHRTVFYSDGPSQRGRMMLPFVMRPVLFNTTERDAENRERDYLVLGLTTTSPERFVQRWMALPRGENQRHLPMRQKTYGQAWLNWRQLYRWVSPYLNVSLSVVSAEALLPSMQEIGPDLSDAYMTLEISYTGLKASHLGPIPVGVVAVPAMLGVSTEEDTSGSSDLARERLACQRLKVLYHHSRLFHQDLGRWPAEVRELDGYIDFAGHPELLELKLSSSKRWHAFFEGIFEAPEEEEATSDEEEGTDKIDDSLYVIEWRPDAWRLGLAPGKLEHLKALYIDQDGVIHRIEKTEEESAPAGGGSKDVDQDKSTRNADATNSKDTDPAAAGAVADNNNRR